MCASALIENFYYFKEGEGALICRVGALSISREGRFVD